jgi:anti-sigma factor RsiW
MRLTSCPSPVQLVALFEGGLPDEELEAVEQHVAECSACLEITKRLHVEKDTLAEQLRIETAVNT